MNILQDYEAYDVMVSVTLTCGIGKDGMMVLETVRAQKYLKVCLMEGAKMQETVALVCLMIKLPQSRLVGIWLTISPIMKSRQRVWSTALNPPHKSKGIVCFKSTPKYWMLLFAVTICLRAEETSESLEDAISEFSKWVASFADDVPASNIDYLDPSAEGWISECFSDPDMQFATEDTESGASDVQVDNTGDICYTPPLHHSQTRQNVVLRGKKSYMRTPSKLPSSVVYPFTFIKPCDVHGDMTLKDINQRILRPPSPKQNEQDPSGLIPTSPFSGKPVVGKTKIRTEVEKVALQFLAPKVNVSILSQRFRRFI